MSEIKAGDTNRDIYAGDSSKDIAAGDMDFLAAESNEAGINESVGVEVGNILSILKKKRQIIEEKETELKRLNAEELEMVRITIPQMFKKHNIWDLSTDYGKVKITEEVTCSLVKDELKRKAAFSWLIDNGGEALIQDVITIESPSPELLAVLNKGGVVYNMQKDVNTNSLKAWFREKLGMKKGFVATLEQDKVPKDFGLFVFDLAKVTEANKGGGL